jgi:sorbitol-specific phosphotransferase system component IIC
MESTEDTRVSSRLLTERRCPSMFSNISVVVNSCNVICPYVRLADLFVERKMCDVDVARRLEYRRRNPQHGPVM